MMYDSSYQLSENPFTLTPDLRYVRPNTTTSVMVAWIDNQ